MFGIRDDLVELVRALCQLEEFNILNLNQAEFEPNDSKVGFAITQLQNLSTSDKLLINVLSHTVTDMNLYQLCYLLEEHPTVVNGISNVILPALLLYCNKLELIVKRLTNDLMTSEELLYGFVPKEALSEALLMSFSGEEDDSVRIRVSKMVKQVNSRATEKAFRSGIGALQDELWRMCHEEGVMIENEEK